MNSSSRRITLVVAYIFFLLFAAMRFYKLSDRPMHNDEGVNSFFLINLLRGNSYKYDPENYHGPILYYIQLVPTWITTLAKEKLDFSFSSTAGVTETSVRVGVVLASLLLLLGVLFCTHRLGLWGGLAAFVLMGFSVDFLYYGRYFIHEIYFVLFTFGIYWGMTKYQESGKQGGLSLAILSATLLYCTKETSVVTFFVMLFSVICVEIFSALRQGLGFKFSFLEIKKRFGKVISDIFSQHWFTLIMAVSLWILFYTSFFKNPHGLIDSILTYTKWTKEGVDSGHNKSFPYFIMKVILPCEQGITVAALIGLMVALVRNDRKGLYLSSWSSGMILAYSVIPYKTVWCVINLLLPMVLLGGWGVQQLYLLAQTIADQTKRMMAYAGLVIAVLFLACFQLPNTLLTTYFEPDSETHVQAYVHTARDIYPMMQRINTLARLSKLDSGMLINFVCKEYWPLPFYTRKYMSVNYWGTYQDIPNLDTYLVVSDPDQDEALKSILKDTYVIEEFSLRAGHPLHLHINKKYFDIRPLNPAPEVFRSTATPTNLTYGLNKRIWAGRRYSGRVLESRDGVDDFSFNYEINKNPVYPIPFCIQWDGYLKIDKAGPQTWILGSDDGSQLFVDGALAIDNDDTHAYLEKKAILKFEPGLHKITIRYFDVGGHKQLKWVRLNAAGQEEPFEIDMLFHEDASTPKKS